MNPVKLSRSISLPLLVAAGALVASPLTWASDANACGAEIMLAPVEERRTPPQEIARAEKLLDDDRFEAATRSVRKVFPRVRHEVKATDPLSSRARRVFALAVVRMNGASPASASAATRAANLDWAVSVLRELDRTRPNDPAVQADLGEALSKVPATHGEALLLLSRLAERDLMGSPHAFTALASLRADEGDRAAAEAAVQRCETISRHPGLCRPANAPAPAAPAAPTLAGAKA